MIFIEFISPSVSCCYIFLPFKTFLIPLACKGLIILYYCEACLADVLTQIKSKMKIAETVSALQELTALARKAGKQIGFVPTMGALHEGHISLVKKARRQNSVVVVSVFVNPTQFNDKKDLEKYPRTLEADIKLLTPAGADIIFCPGVEEVYPDGQDKGADIDLGGLDKYMEGAFRPGHFKGMAQVVKRLLDIVTPDRLYMGQKDFQQFTIVAHMIRTLRINTLLVVCPIKREPNGLAMSSRNERLSAETRAKASIIFRVMKSVRRQQDSKPVHELEKYAMKRLAVSPFEPEYFTIVDGDTLEPVDDLSKVSYAVACVAVWADGVRLIDNIMLKKQ